MKRPEGNRIPAIYFVAGIIAMEMRTVLYSIAVDDRGLLIRRHPLTLCLWFLTLIAAWKAASISGKNRVVPASPAVSGIGAAVLAVVLALQLQKVQPTAIAALYTLHQAMGWLSVGCLAVLAGMLLMNRKPFFLLYAVFSAFLGVHLMLCYQSWSEQPQMMNYLFSLFGMLCLCLFCFCQACCTAGMPYRSRQTFFGLMGILCCCIAVPHGKFPLLYAASAAFLLTQFRLEPIREGE